MFSLITKHLQIVLTIPKVEILRSYGVVTLRVTIVYEWLRQVTASERKFTNVGERTKSVRHFCDHYRVLVIVSERKFKTRF